MTSLTTALGLLPMAIGFGEGAEVRAPMAITVIGGLLVSTFLTLVVIPVGLAILSIEFAWARHWLRKMRETISNGLSNNRARRARAYRDRITDSEKRKAPER